MGYQIHQVFGVECMALKNGKAYFAGLVGVLLAYQRQLLAL